MNTVIRTVLLSLAVSTAVALSCHSFATQPGAVPANPLNLRAVLVTPNVVQLAWSQPATASNLYRLYRNGIVISDSITVPKTDTSWTYKDSGGVFSVVPGTPYTFKLMRLLTNDSSTLQVQALDTSRDNYTFTKTSIGLPGSQIYSIWGASPQNLWLVGTFDTLAHTRTPNVLHIQNGVMTYFQLLGGSSFPFYSVYGVNDTDVYFAGEKILWHWNGQSFDYSVEFYNDSVTSNIDVIYALWVSNNDEIFCGDQYGNIIHRKNGVWINEPSGTQEVICNLFGFSSTDVYASAAYSNIDGTILHYTQNGWTTLIASDSGNLNGFQAVNSVWGDSDDSLVAVGNGIFHRYGNIWQNRTPPNTQLAYMQDVKTRGWNNIWICGYYGFIMHWDGLNYVIFYNYFNLSSMLLFNQILLLPNDVFIVGYDNNSAVFVHGQ